MERSKIMFWVGVAIVAVTAYFTFAHFTKPAGATRPPISIFIPVTLCHATGSLSNPFVEITVATQGALNGHLGHAGDIIPKGEGDCPGPVDVCPNDEGVQTSTDDCTVVPPTDYCETLEGVQAEDVDCPPVHVPTCEELQNCPVDPPVVTKDDDDDHDGSKCEKPGDISGFRFMFVGSDNRLRWNTRDNMPKVDIKVLGPDKTTVLRYTRTRDDGEEMVPGHVNWYRIRGVNSCGLGDWSHMVN